MECNTKAKTSAGWNVLQNVRENLAFFFCAAVAGNGALSRHKTAARIYATVAPAGECGVGS